MADIKAADVKKLRDLTNAGMMDCKNALKESDGDFDTAIDILRKKGLKTAAKRADRDAKEGVVLGAQSADGKKAYIVCLNCETDFVAKGEGFVNLTKEILKAAIDNDAADIDALKALPMGKGTINDEIINQNGVIGEKVELGYYIKIQGEDTVVYNHLGNKLTAIAAFNKAIDKTVEKNVAMQIAAMNPLALDKDDIDQDTINREIEIGKEQAINEGKPADMAEKIAMGRLNKFYKENFLL